MSKRDVYSARKRGLCGFRKNDEPTHPRADTAVVTGALSMSGIWLGNRLTRENESRKWRREHALEAYSAFVRLVDAIIEEATHAYGADCKSEKHRKHATTVAEKLSELRRTSDRIVLISSDEVEAPFSSLSAHVQELGLKMMCCPKENEKEVKAAMSKFFELYAVFMMAARSDLGVHPQKAKRRWWEFVYTKASC